MKLKGILLLIMTILTGYTHAEQPDPIVGKWKTIDDRSGYSRADVEVKKNPNGTYTGIIIETRAIPGRPKMEICEQCPGALKGKPFIGLPFVYDFKQNPNNPYEYIQGHVLDPISGKVYQAKAKINASGKHLTLRGYVGISVVGRSVTWIKYQ
ncbi:DUF2147 domain-containing protein [Acinetobacter sp. S54]|nr:DUF2147 domain-containing protein [Acinetobacter sp. S55]MBK0065633.1 DUF2147 domain-containing protein [Acinetobacter sp. S54]